MAALGTTRAPLLNSVVARNQDARQVNLRTALQAIAASGTTSRADIARATGLTRATVSSLVAELLDQDLVAELGIGDSAGGKPPTLLGLNPTGRGIVALDLSRQPFRGAIFDLAGELQARREAEHHGVHGDDALAEVHALAARLVTDATAPVIGVGIGTPGLVDGEGTVIEAPNLGWYDVPLTAHLADLGLPVLVANDADVAAVAEFARLPADADSVAVVKIASGVGAGVVLAGAPLRGARSAAGEIGHLAVVDGGEPCPCGNVGCLETVASVPAILRAASIAAGSDPDEADGVAWTAAAATHRWGRDALDTAVDAAGRHLGSVLAHLVAILDVAHLVVACGLTGVEERLLAAVDRQLDARLLPSPAGHVQVRTSAHGPDLVLAGASALVASDALGLVWR